MAEKQQYHEGPWQRISGPVPLSGQELESWRGNLNKMYAPEDWRAAPVAGTDGKFDIVVSPDIHSVYAGVARKADREGRGDYPADHLQTQENLGRLALKEAPHFVSQAK